MNVFSKHNLNKSLSAEDTEYALILLNEALDSSDLFKHLSF